MQIPDKAFDMWNKEICGYHVVALGNIGNNPFGGSWKKEFLLIKFSELKKYSRSKDTSRKLNFILTK